MGSNPTPGTDVGGRRDDGGSCRTSAPRDRRERPARLRRGHARRRERGARTGSPSRRSGAGGGSTSAAGCPRAGARGSRLPAMRRRRPGHRGLRGAARLVPRRRAHQSWASRRLQPARVQRRSATSTTTHASGTSWRRSSRADGRTPGWSGLRDHHVSWKHWPCLSPSTAPDASTSARSCSRTGSARSSRHTRRVPPRALPLRRLPGQELDHAGWSPGERKRYDYPRWQFTNNSADIRELCCWALDLVDVPWRQSNRRPSASSTPRRRGPARRADRAEVPSVWIAPVRRRDLVDGVAHPVHAQRVGGAGDAGRASRR